jgi:hypothetical protein
MKRIFYISFDGLFNVFPFPGKFYFPGKQEYKCNFPGIPGYRR